MFDEITHFQLGTNSRQNWEKFIRKLNRMIDAVNEHSEVFEEMEEESRRGGKREKRESKVKSSGGETVLAANLTGEYLGAYHAVRLESPPEGDSEPIDMLNDFHNADSVMLAKMPNGDESAFAVSLSTVNKNGCFVAKLTGLTGMMVDVEDLSHEYATTKNNETGLLVSTETGYAKILFKPKKTGKQFCFILLGVSAAVEAGDRDAIVMRAIKYSDPIAPPEDRHYGKILLPEQEPPRNGDGEIDIDKLPDCCCLTLGKDPNEPGQDEEAKHQQLIKGDSVKRNGPHRRKNPNYVPPSGNEEPSEPEYIDFYMADPIAEYFLPVDSDIQWDMEADPPEAGDSTITRKDSDGNEASMFVSGEMITQGFMVTGNAESYIVRNKNTNDGRKLIIVGGRCQQRVE